MEQHDSHYERLSIIWGTLSSIVIIFLAAGGFIMSNGMSEHKAKTVIACVQSDRDWVNDECRK